MKKLLILAVLALGLCASPALAGTIDFTKVDYDFINALNSTIDKSKGTGAGGASYQLPGSEAGIELTFVAYPDGARSQFNWSGDVNKGWYKSAKGLSIELYPTKTIYNGNGYLMVRFYSDLAQQVYGVIPEGFSITFSTAGIDAPSIGADNERLSTWQEIGKDKIDADGFITIDFADLLASDSLLEYLVVKAPMDATIKQPLTLTISSISYPDHYGASAVPVPAAVWLLGTGVAGVAALRRKFK